MNKAYYLKTCNTCMRILGEINTEGFSLQEVKAEPINEAQLEELYKHTQSYEALFNKRAQKYQTSGLKEKQLDEAKFKALILGEYTFLKRPAFVIDEKVFVGNSKKTIAALKEKLEK